MLAMDSGNAHLAAMYGVPTMTLWGNTHPYAGFAPVFQPENHQLLPDRNQYPGLPTSVFGKEVPKGYEKVMETIDPKTVAHKMRELLEAARAE
jgi:ADP-heptose:LPS heptosyltransferase